MLLVKAGEKPLKKAAMPSAAYSCSCRQAPLSQAVLASGAGPWHAACSAIVHCSRVQVGKACCTALGLKETCVDLMVLSLQQVIDAARK